MTDSLTHDTQAREKSGSLHQKLTSAWSNRPGWGVLSSVNHGTVGVWFMLTGAAFFLVGGVLAMLMRSQLAIPDNTLLDAALYNQIFTMHGTVMMFLFAIPVLEGMAIYMIPKMVGARDLVFPRLSAFGYYCYLFGGLIILMSLFGDMAPDTGWFMYTPLSSAQYSPGSGPDFWLLGITFVEISAISAGVELTVSILRSRAPGMTLKKMPIFCWCILAMALMIIFGFPPLILASVMLELERAAGMPFFDVAGGGDPLLWQHLFWLFGHPEVYIIFLPAAGVVSTLIPVFAGRPMVGYGWVVFSIMLMGFVSFSLWVHHMFTVGIPQFALAFFSAASMLVAIPTGIQIFSWLATLWSGRVVFALPMLWIFGFLVIFVCGGLTGVMLALVPFNWQVHDTHFVVAHMHYVLVGGMFFPLIAGLYYWLPHFSGRMPSDKLGRWAFWLTFIGFNMTFLLMHLTGLLGMPRRVYSYESGMGWDGLNLLSSVGGFVMAAGVAMIIVDVAMHFRFGRRALPNPWQADTLEWALPMSPRPYNFASIPSISTRHPLWHNSDLPASIAAGDHMLATTSHGRRETLLTEAGTARVQAIIHLPSNSWLPLLTALVMATVCITLLAKAYLWALGAAVLAAVFLLRWSWVNGAHPGSAPIRSDDPVDPPLHSRTTDGPGLWGMVVTLMANATLYLSLLFGWFYFWTVSPQRIVPDEVPISFTVLFGSGLLLLLSAAVYQNVVTRARAGLAKGLQARLLMVLTAGFFHSVSLVWVMLTSPLQASDLTHDALILFLLMYLVFHSVLSWVLTLLQLFRVKAGYVGAKMPYELIVVRPMWIYTTVVFWTGMLAFFGMPLVWPVSS
ncbi:MAG: cytochrome c oxidase subunit I [Pseudohongiella sp.]|uniref:cytochrome c oxidase subunit I n=1 Tax=Pseudohongiella sp. TaxID=1979412 RepID=UPI0034A0A171